MFIETQNLFLVLSTNNVESYANYMTIYDYYYDDDCIYYICLIMFHCFEMQLLEHVVNRKRQQNTNRTYTKNNNANNTNNNKNNSKGNFTTLKSHAFLMFFKRYFIYFLQRLYTKKQWKTFFIIMIIITLYIYDYDYNYKWTKWRK